MITRGGLQFFVIPQKLLFQGIHAEKMQFYAESDFFYRVPKNIGFRINFLSPRKRVEEKTLRNDDGSE
jgi:hypothetical protein